MEANLAVLIDFENIAAGTEKEGLGRFNVEALMQRIKDKGRILVARSYADWGRFSRFKQGLLSENVTMMELTSHGMQDKNRADIAMVVDALELAFTKGYIDTFVVVSGDSDFTPMVQKMRELNKRVIGCGTRKSTSRLLIGACDEFIFYDTIVQPNRKKRRKKSPDGKMDRPAAFDLLCVALEGLQRENPDPPLAGIVKQAMLRKSPDFSDTDLGFGSFARFLEAAKEGGHVQLMRDRKSGGYRVDAIEAGTANGHSEAGPAVQASNGWHDEYLPQGTDSWVATLSERGLDPLAAPTRMAVLEAIEEAVAERKKRRRKTNSHFITEDVKKKLRRTHPDLPLKKIRGLMDALRASDLLIHRDGMPVRTPSASFRLEKTAEEMNQVVMGTFLRHLRDAGSELTDSKRLAELFLGDPDRAREVEETIAWMATQPMGEGDEAELNAGSLDDLLEVDGAAEATPINGTAPEVLTADGDEAAEEAVEEAADDADGVEAAAEVEDAAEVEGAPEVEDAPEAEEAPEAEAAPEAADEAPKPRTTRKRRRKPTTTAASTLDDLLE